MTHPRDADDPAGLARAERDLLVRRLPLFAAGWLALGSVLRVGLVLRGGLGVPIAVGSIALQAAVLAAAWVWCRETTDRGRVVRIVLSACLALVVLAAGFFASLGGSLEGMVFAAGAICIGSSLAFGWGWRPAAVLAVGSVSVGILAVPWLASFSEPIEIALEVLIGAGVAVTAAESSARSFRLRFVEAERESAANRRLAAAYGAYRDLAENARDLIFTHDLDGRITYVNEAFARSYGTSAAELVGRDATDLVPRDPSNPDPVALRARLAAGEEVPPQVFWVKGPNGRRWLESVTSAIRDHDGRIIGARGISRDVTERHTAEEALRASLEELRRSEERLRRLARHQASIREDERKRLGFDLHDDVCQELVGIGILVEALRRRITDASPEVASELGRVGRYVGEVGEHLRQLARDLRPMMLRDLGLEESLRSLADAMTQAGTLVCATFPTPVPRLGEETEIGVYRIAQEALANVLRHTSAGRVDLTLAVHDDRLTLAIVDDGAGFAPEARRGGEALGLIGMEERALALGGRLEVRSAPDRGTTVRLTCPVTLRAASAA